LVILLTDITRNGLIRKNPLFQIVMAKNNTLLYVGLGAAAYYFFRQYRLYQGIQFSVVGAGIKLKPLQLNFKIGIENPTPVSSRLDSITGLVYQNGTYVAQVNYNDTQIIAPFNRTIITLNVIPDLLGTLQAALQYRIPFQFRGVAVVNGIRLPLNLEYQIGSPNPQP